MPKSKSFHRSLTETFCKRRTVRAALQITDYYDTRLANLSLRLTPPSKQHRSGLLTWRFGFRVNGKKGVVTVGRYPAWSADAALLKGRKLQVMVDEGKDPREASGLPRKPIAASPATIDVVAKMFRRYAAERLSEKSDSHRINTVGYFERHVLKAWDGRDVRSLTKRDASDLIQTVKTENGPVAANRLATALVTWGAFMTDVGVLDASPFVRLPKTAEQERQRSLVTIREDGALDLGEIVAVWRAAERLGGPAGRFVRLLVTTAVRRDEAAQLPRTEVNLEEGTWILPAARCKTGRRAGRDFLIPLSLMARAVLMECPDVGPYYFSKTGKRPISGFAHIKESIDDIILEMRGLPLSPAWCFHDLRRTVRTALSGLKVDDAVGEAVLNHLPQKLLRTYAINSLAAEKRQALTLWSDRLDAALASVTAVAPEVPVAAE
jgi:integrase